MNKIINFELNDNIEEENNIIKIEEQCINEMPLNKEEIENLLNSLSYSVRKRIAEEEGKNINNCSYSMKCDLAQSIIYYYLKNLNIKVNPININDILPGVIGHSLVVATFQTDEGEKDYLIDPTYIQFFEKENCNSNKYVILNNRICISPDPGYFVVKDNKQEEIKPLLTNGFIELNEEIAKIYGDSFFQTKQGPIEELKYNVATGSDYIKWFHKYTSKLSKTEEELVEKEKHL